MPSISTVSGEIPVQRNRVIAIGVVAIIVIAVGVYAYYATLQPTVKLVLKDPPAQASTYGAIHIWVSFSSIEVHQVRSGGSGSWIAIQSTNTTIDLVAIITTPETLGTFSIASGNYTEIRFNVTSARAQISVGAAYLTLNISGSTVLDAHFPGQLTLSTGQSATITADFTADNTSLLSGHLSASLTASLS